MKLKNYLLYKNLTISAFAKGIEVSQPFISLIISGNRTPSPKMAKKISDGANGEVTVLELLFPDNTQ